MDVIAAVLAVVVLLGLAIGSTVDRYFQSRKKQIDPVAWQHYPVASRYVVLILSLVIMAALIYVFFLPGHTASNRRVIAALVVVAGGGVVYGLQNATFRIRVYEGILQVRSLFKDIDVTPDDIADTTVSSVGAQGIYRVRLKNGKRLALDYVRLNLGEFDRVLRSRAARPRR